MKKSLLIQYINLLHKYKNINAPKVRQFLQDNSEDYLFVKRAKAFNDIFKLRESLTE
jgi:uncharacterized protein YutE (UPF0331/DUF86 family)